MTTPYQLTQMSIASIQELQRAINNELRRRDSIEYEKGKKESKICL